jgi:hypothetical protein
MVPLQKHYPGRLNGKEQDIRHLEIMRVILSAAKDLARLPQRSFAMLRACSERSEGMTGRTSLKPAHGKPSLEVYNRISY